MSWTKISFKKYDEVEEEENLRKYDILKNIFYKHFPNHNYYISGLLKIDEKSYRLHISQDIKKFPKSEMDKIYEEIISSGIKVEKTENKKYGTNNLVTEVLTLPNSKREEKYRDHKEEDIESDRKIKDFKESIKNIIQSERQDFESKNPEILEKYKFYSKIGYTRK